MFAQRSSRLRVALPFYLAILPPIFIGGCIFVYGVDFPTWDEWIIGSYLDKFAHNALTVADLFQQQNEYRQFFPNLVFVSLGWLTKWDVRSWMFASLLFACLISSNIYHLDKWSLARRPRWTYFIANLLIFSPVQYDNWLQGQQLIYFLPIACLTASLLVATADRLSNRTRFIVCAMMSIISSFSAANGMLCWVLLLPLLTWPWSKAELSRKKFWILAWLLMFGLSASLYFYHYRTSQSDTFAWKTNPSHELRSLLVLLGEPLALSRFYVPLYIGLILVGLFVWSCWSFWSLRKTSPSEARRMLCWLLIGAYSILTALLITVGRSDFLRAYRTNPATPPRYTTYCIYLSVAVIYLVPMTLRATNRELRFKFTTRQLLATLGTAIVLAHLFIYLVGLRRMSAHSVELQQNKACGLFVNVLDEACLRSNVYPDTVTLKRIINATDRLGFIRPPLIKTNRISDIENIGTERVNNSGAFESVVQENGETFIAKGRAGLTDKGRQPDAVLLTYDDPNGSAIIFAIARLDTVERDFISAMKEHSFFGDSHWSKSFPASAIGSEPAKISAWGFDASTGRAYKLEGKHVVQKSNDSDNDHVQHPNR